MQYVLPRIDLPFPQQLTLVSPKTDLSDANQQFIEQEENDGCQEAQSCMYST